MCYILIVSPQKTIHAKLTDILHKYFANVVILPSSYTAEDALKESRQAQPEIILLDLSTPKALALQPQLIDLHPNLRTIVIDQAENFEHAQIAIRMGAMDLLISPLKTEEVLKGIHRTIISLNQVSLLSFYDKSALPTQNRMILPMIQYIHKYYYEELTLDVLSKFMHLNKDYLSKLFKQEVRMTFVTYLNHYRVEQAKLFLRTTDDSLADIAEAVGYQDPTYFSRIFKRLTKLSPKEYRETFVGDFIPAPLF